MKDDQIVPYLQVSHFSILYTKFLKWESEQTTFYHWFQNGVTAGLYSNY